MCASQREENRSPLEPLVDMRKAPEPAPAHSDSESQQAAEEAHAGGDSSSDSILTSDSSRMYHFKVDECPLCTLDPDHEQADCPYAHPGERSRRRDPRLSPYTCVPCPEFRKHGTCKRGDACNLAHGVYESWLHPTKYRMITCHDAGACTRAICFFAHSAAELRVAPPAPEPGPSTTSGATTATSCPVPENSQPRSAVAISSGSALGALHQNSSSSGQRHSNSATALHRVDMGFGASRADSRPSTSVPTSLPSSPHHSAGGVKPWSPHKPSPSSPRATLHCASASQGGSRSPTCRLAVLPGRGTGKLGVGYACAASFRPSAACLPPPPPEPAQRWQLAQQQQQLAVQQRQLAQEQDRIRAVQLTVMSQHAANVQTQQHLWRQQQQLQQLQQQQKQRLMFLGGQLQMAPHSSGSMPRAAPGLPASSALLPPRGGAPVARTVWHEDWTTIGGAAAPAASPELLLGMRLQLHGPPTPDCICYTADAMLAAASGAGGANTTPSTGALSLNELLLLEQQLQAAVLQLAEAAPPQPALQSADLLEVLTAQPGSMQQQFIQQPRRLGRRHSAFAGGASVANAWRGLW